MSSEHHKVMEKSPLSSKKLIAAMTWNIMWLFLIGYGIRMQVAEAVLMAMIITSGSTQMTYLGGQAAVDAYVRRMIVGFGKKPPKVPKVPAVESTTQKEERPLDEERPQINLS